MGAHDARCHDIGSWKFHHSKLNKSVPYVELNRILRACVIKILINTNVFILNSIITVFWLDQPIYGQPLQAYPCPTLPPMTDSSLFLRTKKILNTTWTINTTNKRCALLIYIRNSFKINLLVQIGIHYEVSS